MKKKTNNPQFDEVFYFEVGVSVAQMQLKHTPQGLWHKDPQSLTSESSGVLSPHVKTPSCPAARIPRNCPSFPGQKGCLLLPA